eukprot:1072435-Amphidinium_carterae.2
MHKEGYCKKFCSRLASSPCWSEAFPVVLCDCSFSAFTQQAGVSAERAPPPFNCVQAPVAHPIQGLLKPPTFVVHLPAQIP